MTLVAHLLASIGTLLGCDPCPIPAFPDAVGGGAHSVGGRGGIVIPVTTLDDDGPGSLREAIDTEGPRTVVFRVAGTIELASPLFIDDPFLTIAGQTAPGGGICVSAENITSSPFFLGTHDVIVRYLRIRAAGEAPGPFKDAMSIGEDVGPVRNVIFDHCSFSWANDEVFQVWSDTHPARDITLQRSIVSEGLDYDNHSRGVIIGSNTICDEIRGVTFYRNLFAHNAGRNPYVKVRDARIVNNITYNWGFLATQTAGGIRCDVVSNLYIAGPDSDTRPVIAHRMSEPWAGCNWGPEGDPSLYIAGNVSPDQPDPEGEQWGPMIELVGYGNGWGWPGDPPVQTTPPASFKREQPMPGHVFPLHTVSAQDLEAVVLPTVGASRRLNDAGAWVDARDEVDRRVVCDVSARTGSIIERPAGFPTLPPGVPYVDTDLDGMPDQFETDNDLDPNDPEDRNQDEDNDGYTNLEEFLNATPVRG